MGNVLVHQNVPPQVTAVRGLFRPPSCLPGSRTQKFNAPAIVRSGTSASQHRQPGPLSLTIPTAAIRKLFKRRLNVGVPAPKNGRRLSPDTRWTTHCFRSAPRFSDSDGATCSHGIRHSPHTKSLSATPPITKFNTVTRYDGRPSPHGIDPKLHQLVKNTGLFRHNNCRTHRHRRC